MYLRHVPRRTSLSAAAAITAVLTLSASMSGAVASPDTSPPEASGPAHVTPAAKSSAAAASVKRSVAAQDDGEWVGPSMLPRIQDYDLATGMVFDESTQTVGRQKLTFKLPRITMMVYTGTCRIADAGRTVNQVGRYGAYDGCRSYPNEVAEAIDKLVSKVPEIPYWLGFGGDAWIQSPPGASQPFGQLPPITVRSVAFGSIPVQATVHLSQSVRGGLITPFHLVQIATLGTIPEGTVVPGLGPAPAANGNGAVAVQFPVTFTGSLDVKLSDVTVDGTPLELGRSCVASANLSMSPNTNGFLDGSDPVRGQPGEFSVGFPGKSHLPGNVVIGAFSGCESGGENLNPLLTSMISGHDNPIDETLMSSYTIWCQENIYLNEVVGREACNLNYAPPTGDASSAARRSAPPSSLSPKSVESLKAMPKGVMDALPAQYRKQLKQLTTQLAAKNGAGRQP